jgi:hypothetical protein
MWCESYLRNCVFRFSYDSQRDHIIRDVTGYQLTTLRFIFPKIVATNFLPAAFYSWRVGKLYSLFFYARLSGGRTNILAKHKWPVFPVRKL